MSAMYPSHSSVSASASAARSGRRRLVKVALYVGLLADIAAALRSAALAGLIYFVSLSFIEA
jgi:hypothetical protein